MITLGIAEGPTGRKLRQSNPPGWDGASGFRFSNGTFYSTDSGGENIQRWMELAPAIGIITQTYARVLKNAPLTLVRPNGDILRWPPKDGRQALSRAMQVLRLWSECPNTLQTIEQFLDCIANNWVRFGDVICRLYRDGGDVPTEQVIIASDRVHLGGTIADSFPLYEQLTPGLGAAKLVYHYGSQSIQLDPKRPGIFHCRTNVDPRYQYRGRPAAAGMPYEVAACALASIYRKEIFRQGGPVRIAIQSGDEEDFGQAATLDQLQRISDKLATEMKASESWMKYIPVLPTGFQVKDFGPKTADEMYIGGSRYVDEKIAAAYGVTMLYMNNMENSTYNNSRQQIAVLQENAGSQMFKEIESNIKRSILAPMGGEAALLEPKFDLKAAMKFENAIHTKLEIDKFNAGITSANEAREALDYEPLPEARFQKPMDKTPKAPKMQKAPAPDAKGTAKPPADK